MCNRYFLKLIGKNSFVFTLDELVPTITTIANASLASAMFPISIKQVTPLLKKSDLDPDVHLNYRPVSYLSFLSKVLERAVAARLTEYSTDI